MTQEELESHVQMEIEMAKLNATQMNKEAGLGKIEDFEEELRKGMFNIEVTTYSHVKLVKFTLKDPLPGEEDLSYEATFIKVAQ